MEDGSGEIEGAQAKKRRRRPPNRGAHPAQSEPMKPAPVPPPELGQNAWKRLAVTVLALVFVEVLQRVPLPGVDWVGVSQGDSGERAIGVGGLGVTPIVNAYLLVELSAWIIPSWRPLRESAAGRAVLRRRVVPLALTIAGMLALVYARALSPFALGHTFGSGALVCLTLIAGSALLWFAAEVITHRGFGSGLLVVWSFLGVRVLGKNLPPLGGDPGMDALLLMASVVFGVGLAVAAAWLVRPAEAVRQGALAVPELPTPAASVGALDLIRFVVLAVSLGVPGLLPPLPRDALSAIAMGLVLHCGGAIVVAWLTHRPDGVASRLEGWGAVGGAAGVAAARDGLVRALLSTGLFFFVFILADALVRDKTDSWSAITSLLLLVVLLRDAWREWPRWRGDPSWTVVHEEHRPYVVPFVERTLHNASIPFFTRDLVSRTALQIFAPFAPVRIAVQAADVQRAREALAGAAAQIFSDAPQSEGPRERPSPRRLWPLALLATLALGGSLAFPYLQTATNGPPPTAEERRAALQFYAVDDDADPLEDLAQSGSEVELPKGLRFEVENVPLGPGRTAPRHFALFILGPSETIDALLARSRPWLAANVSLPPGRAFYFEKRLEMDDDTGELAVIGLRSYLLESEPVLTGADVASASVEAEPANQGGGYHVALTFTSEAGRRFHDYTASHIKRRFAIVSRGLIESAPVIQTAIPGGRAQITLGSASPADQKKDATAIVEALRGKAW